MPRDYFYELSARQIGVGHEVDVVTWKRNGGLQEERMPEGFSIHRLQGFNLGIGNFVQEYPYLPSLPTEIETLRPDIVHIESHLFLTALQAVRKANRMGLPCIVTVHGVFAERGVAVNFAQHVYLRSLGLKVLKAADGVVCLTRSDAAAIERLGCPSAKITLVSNAVDIDLFRPCGEREDDLVVWVGRFVPEKGVEYLIEAAKVVVDQRRHARFLLIGYGPLKSKIVKMASDYGLLGKSVVITGPLDRVEIAKIVSRSSVFAFPSLKEGMPLSLLEAMASGNAVVASDIQGVNEVAENDYDAVLVSPKSPSDLASSILMLLDDKGLRRRLAENARKKVQENCSWSNVLAKLDRVYTSAEVTCS
jgi:glycosyltransferase involved in cell wall biosynthesis